MNKKHSFIYFGYKSYRCLQKNNMFLFNEFLAGYFGGVCGCLVGYPLDTIKTIQQSTNLKVQGAVIQILKLDGTLGFYRGLFLPLISTGFTNAIVFSVHGNTYRIFQSLSDEGKEEGKKCHLVHVFFSGCVAGFVQANVLCPVELVKTRKQTGACYMESSIRCLINIYKNDGFRGFYRGYIPLLGRDVVPCGIYMLSYDMLVTWFNQMQSVKDKKKIFSTSIGNRKLENYELSLASQAGAVSGVLSWICAIPFDVIKTILQAETKESKYKNWYHCVTENVKYNGWTCLFRGGYLLLFRAIPVNAAVFFGYSWFLQHLIFKKR